MTALEPGETILRTGTVGWIGGEGTRSGTLSLTNRALIFEGPVPQGAPGPGRRGSPPTFAPGVMRIGLWRCRNASVTTWQQSTVLDLELLQRHIYFQVDDPNAWSAEVNRARVTAPPPPPRVAERAGLNVAARGPAMTRCPFCGNASPAGSTRCASCGAPF